jgi:hypothetical protein
LVEDEEDVDKPHHEVEEDLEGGVNGPRKAPPSISSRWMPNLIDIYDDDEMEEGDRIFSAHIHPEDTMSSSQIDLG